MLDCQKPKKKRQPPFITRPDGREICTKTFAGRFEYRERTEQMWQRQIGYCAIGNHKMLVEDATFDHEAGRGMNGSNRDDRIETKNGDWINAAVCVTCNGNKGSQRYRWYRTQYMPVTKFQEVA